MKEKEYGYRANWNWIVTSVIIVAICTTLVIYCPAEHEFDWMVLKSVREFLGQFPSYIPLFFSEFGMSYNMFWPIFAACCALCSNQKYLKAFLLIFFVEASYYLNMLIKDFVCRERPCGDAYPGFSFPSNHAATETCFLGICIYLIWHYTRNTFWRYFLSIFLGLYLIMVCVSRMWLNHHFPVDVFAGFFMGIFCVNLYIISCKFFDRA